MVAGDQRLPTQQAEALPELGAVRSDGRPAASALLLAAASHGALHLLPVLAGPSRDSRHQGGPCSTTKVTDLCP